MPSVLCCQYCSFNKDSDKNDEVTVSFTEKKTECNEFTCGSAENGAKHNRHGVECYKLAKVILVFLGVINVVIITAIFVLYCTSYDRNVDNAQGVRDQDVIYLPCNVNSTDGQNGHHYCKQDYNNTKKALINLITLIHTEYIGRRNMTIDPAVQDDNRPILKQKYSEQCYIDRANKTSLFLELYKTKAIRRTAHNNKTTLTVPLNGTYMVYVTIMYCFRRQNTSGVVFVQIKNLSTRKSSVLYHNYVSYGHGSLTFVPHTCLFPVRLMKDDKISVHITGTEHLYQMRVGNIFGLREITSE